MSLCKRGEAGGKPPGRLESHHRMRPRAELLPQGAQRALAARQVADELVPLADEPARHERRLDRRRPRQHGHRDAGLDRGGDQPRTRVADGRKARVARQGDALAGLQPREHLGGPRRLVVLVVAEQPRTDSMPLQELPRVPRVLAEHELRLGQLAQHAQGDVLEVADRSRADRERHYSRAS